MERPKRLTQAFIKGVKQPGRYGDGRGSYGLSLVVRLSADGGLSKSFVQQLRRSIDRSTINLGLGSAERRTLQEARELAFDNYRRVRDGEEVRQPRGLPPAKVVPTLREVADKWFELSRKNWKSDYTELLTRQRLENHVSPLLDVRVDRISRQHILDALLGIQATPTRERVRKSIRGIMGHAVLREWRLDNPADDALRAALSTAEEAAEAPRRAALRRDSPRPGQGRRTRRLAGRATGIALHSLDRHQKRRGSRRTMGRD